MVQIVDPFFESVQPEYKRILNPNNPEDKTLCISVQDGSKFDGAIVRYTKFKMAPELNEDESIDCQYEYEFEVPPLSKENISDEEGEEFERKLGEWVLDMLQTKLEQHAKTRKRDTEESSNE